MTQLSYYLLLQLQEVSLMQQLGACKSDKNLRKILRKMLQELGLIVITFSNK